MPVNVGDIGGMHTYAPPDTSRSCVGTPHESESQHLRHRRSNFSGPGGVSFFPRLRAIRSRMVTNWSRKSRSLKAFRQSILWVDSARPYQDLTTSERQLIVHWDTSAVG